MLYSDTPEDQRPGKIDYIDRRWKQLSELELKRFDTALNYLFLVSGGASAATLAYLGNLAKEPMSIPGGVYLMLLFFVVSLLLVGLLKIVLVYDVLSIFDSWRRLVGEYYEDKIGWADMNETDAANAVKMRRRIELIGWAAFLSLFIGVVVGGYQLISGGQHGRSKETTNTTSTSTTPAVAVPARTVQREESAGSGHEDRNSTSQPTATANPKEIVKEKKDVETKAGGGKEGRN